MKSSKYKRVIIKLSKLANIDKPSDVQSDETTTENSESARIPDEQPKAVKKRKCRYENKGHCKDGSSCSYFHPKRTCQSSSKLGSCPTEYSCNLRHPIGICHEWSNNGACHRSENCRLDILWSKERVLIF